MPEPPDERPRRKIRDPPPGGDGKTLRVSERRNAYTFAVHPDANKVQVRLAVEELFKVKVDGVRTDLRKGKPRRVGWSEMKTPRGSARWSP